MSGFEALLIGETLGGRYRVEAVLGGGGFGVVFRATDARSGRDVAVKVLNVPPGLDADARARLRDRFRHEAAYAARLPRHPNVVPLFDYGSDRGLDFLVMELLRGEDLRARLARPDEIPLPLALRIFRDAARGVAVGHRDGLVHRDVKPGNVFLEDAPGGMVVRILDFGIATRVDGGEDERTRTLLTRHGEGFFSCRYASPEQLRRERGLSRATDVFSLGVVAFELLTRTRLFGDADQARREAGLPVPIPSLTARNPQVPASVEAVVRQALAHDPADRYRDAAALEEALRAACRAEGLRLDHATRPSIFPWRRRGATQATASAPAASGVVSEDDGTQIADATEAVPGSSPAASSASDATKTGAAHPPAGAPRRAPLGSRLRSALPRRAPQVAAGVALLFGGGFVVAAAADAWGGRDGRDPAPVAAEAPSAGRSAFDANRDGLARFRAGQYERALRDFRRAHEEDPSSAEYHNNLGWTLYRMGRADEAAAVLRSVVRSHPERTLAYENLAAAHLARGDTAAAVRTLREMLRRDPPASRRRTGELLLARLRSAEADGRRGVAVEPTRAVPVYVEPQRFRQAPRVEVDAQEFPAPSRRARRGAPRDTIRIAGPAGRVRDTVRIAP